MASVMGRAFLIKLFRASLSYTFRSAPQLSSSVPADETHCPPSARLSNGREPDRTTIVPSLRRTCYFLACVLPYNSNSVAPAC